MDSETTTSSGTGEDPPETDGADLQAAAAAARGAAFPGVAAGRTARLAAQFDAWLAVTGQVALPPGATVRLPMLTGSMHPALPRGCTLVIEPRPAGDPAVGPGEVAVFAGEGRLVAHRVLRRAGARVLEMGDANRRACWRPVTDVVGRVRAARTADGAPLPDPRSRRRALKGLLRHLRGWLSGASDDDPDSTPNGAEPHDA